MPLDPNDPDVQALQKSVTDLTTERDTAVASVETITVERDTAASGLEAGTKQIGELQEANKKFVDQMGEMKPKIDGLPVLQEEATKLREQVGIGLDQANRGDLVDHDTVFANLRARANQ